MEGKFAIQRYWLGTGTLESALLAFNLKRDDPRRAKAAAIIAKSKKDFVAGWSFFTREDIEKKVLAAIERGGKGVRA